MLPGAIATLHKSVLQHLFGITILEIPKLMELSMHLSGRKQVFMGMSASLAPPETKKALFAPPPKN